MFKLVIRVMVFNETVKKFDHEDALPKRVVAWVFDARLIVTFDCYAPRGGHGLVHFAVHGPCSNIDATC